MHGDVILTSSWTLADPLIAYELYGYTSKWSYHLTAQCRVAALICVAA